MGNFFNGALVLTVMTYVGYQLKSLPTFIWQQVRKQFIHTIMIEQTNVLFFYFEDWLRAFHEDKFRTMQATLFIEEDDYSKGNGLLAIGDQDQSNSRKETLRLDHYSDFFILKYKNKRLMITKGKEKLDKASDLRNVYFSHFRIEGWRVKQTVIELLEEVIVYNQNKRQYNKTIYVNDNNGYWNFFSDVLSKDINNVFIKDKEILLKDIDTFIQEEQWYQSRGLNYRRGYLLYGNAGNGKTSMCLALAKHLNRDIYFLNLKDLEEDMALYNVFKNLNSKAILVIEDIDCLFNKRDSADNKKEISFSALLNCLDGSLSKYGVITIMTTNHKERLDEALIREGRIDCQLEINNPESFLIEQYLKLFYDDQTIVFAPQEYDRKYSMSKVQEQCLRNRTNATAVINMLIEGNR